MTGSPRAVWLAPLLVVVACGTVSGPDAAAKLEPGITDEEAIARLAEGGRLRVIQAVELPADGHFEDVIDDPRLLGAALSAGARSPRPIASVLQLERSVGLSADEFYLFFDAERRLTYHERVRVR